MNDRRNEGPLHDHDLPTSPASRRRHRDAGAPVAPGVAMAMAIAIAMALPAHAACKVETLELPVQMTGLRAVATVGINGTPVPLAVDSGAFFSFLTEAAAAQLKLPLRRNNEVRIEGVTGSVDSYRTRVDKLHLLKGDVDRVEFLVGGNEPGAGTMGLMGRNILSFTDTEYDLAHGVIRFLFPKGDCARANMAYWAGSTPVTEVDLESGPRDGPFPAIRTRVQVNGAGLTALLDTGAVTVLSTRAARRAGVAEATMTPAGSVHGFGRGSARSWTAPFETFQIGGETIRNNKLLVAELNLDDSDLLLGIDFFLSHRIYVSKQQAKLFLTYNGGPVFGLNAGETASARDFANDPGTDGAQTPTADQLARRGAALFARRNFEGALADLDRACELDPTSAPLFAQRAALQEALGRHAKALDDLDRALALDPALPDARAQRAWLRFEANDGTSASADLDALDKTLAAQSQRRLDMSNLYLRLEQPARALAQLNQWLPAHPSEVRRDVALNRRCWIRAMLGTALDEALDDCNDALAAEPKNPSYLDSRGWVHLRLGRHDRALADFDLGLAIRPDDAWSLYGRGLTRSRKGDMAGSEADLAAARRARSDIDRVVERAGLTGQAAATP